MMSAPFRSVVAALLRAVPVAAQEAGASERLAPMAEQGVQELLLQATEAESALQWSQALQRYLEAERAGADSESVLLGQARVLLADGRPSDAATLLDRAVATHPRSVRLLRAAGDSVMAVGSPSMAAGYFRRALELAPEDLEVRARLAWVLHIDGHHGEVVDLLDGLHRENLPSYALLALGRSALIEDRAVLAAPVLEEWVEQAPDDVDAWLDLARARFLIRDDEGVLSALSVVLGKRPESAKAYVLLGHVRSRWGQYELALRAYEEAVRLGANAWVLEPAMARARNVVQRLAWNEPR